MSRSSELYKNIRPHKFGKQADIRQMFHLLSPPQPQPTDDIISRSTDENNAIKEGNRDNQTRDVSFEDEYGNWVPEGGNTPHYLSLLSINVDGKIVEKRRHIQ